MNFEEMIDEIEEQLLHLDYGIIEFVELMKKGDFGLDDIQKISEYETFLTHMLNDLYQKVSEIKGLDDPAMVEQAKKTMTIVDNLLGRLPNEEVYKFSKSRKFKMYEKVINALRG